MDSSMWRQFADFCKAELATGGPDPQLAIMTHLAKDSDVSEALWLAGCYGAHHCVPSAFAVWHHFRPDSLLYDLDHVADWLDEHWQELSVRPEMRSHRMLQKRVQCLHDFARYAVETQLMYKDYDTIWQDSQQKVKYYGRYMAIKYLELLHRMTNKRSFASYDIRAKHAWSPRKTLGILFPENMHILANRYDNSDSAVTLSEAVATIAKNRLRDEGVEVSYFQLQVMLCEFKEFLEGGYYPGASHDEEMDYMAKSSSFDMTPIWEARAALFPHEYLGEFGGWSGIRKDRLR